MKMIKNSFLLAMSAASFVATNAAARPIKIPMPPSAADFSLLDQLWGLLTAILPSL
jgi:hypothetical protein